MQRRPTQLAPTANELCRAARVGRPGFDTAQVKEPAAGAGASWPPLGRMLTGGAPRIQSNTAAVLTDRNRRFTLIINSYWESWSESDFPLTHLFFSINCWQRAQRGNETTKWGLSCNCCCLLAKPVSQISPAPSVRREGLSCHTFVLWIFIWFEAWTMASMCFLFLCDLSQTNHSLWSICLVFIF